MKKALFVIVSLIAALTESHLTKDFQIKDLKEGTTLAGGSAGGTSTCVGGIKAS